jgi:ketosteroid isomerase-like protein
MKEIPEVITRYIEASNRFDATAAADCFCADAHVHDEGHDHRGQESIRNWISGTSRKYQAYAEVLRARGHADQWQLTVHTSGNFPGSPIDIDYAIVLRAGKIFSLNFS